MIDRRAGATGKTAARRWGCTCWLQKRLSSGDRIISMPPRYLQAAAHGTSPAGGLEDAFRAGAHDVVRKAGFMTVGGFEQAIKPLLSSALTPPRAVGRDLRRPPGIPRLLQTDEECGRRRARAVVAGKAFMSPQAGPARAARTRRGRGHRPANLYSSVSMRTPSTRKQGSSTSVRPANSGTAVAAAEQAR